MQTTINATDLRIRTRDIIERARFKGEHFVVHTFGKPVAVILGIEEYNALMQSAENARPCVEEKLASNVLQPALEVYPPTPLAMTIAIPELGREESKI